jgi:hypothetical protein
MEAAGPPVNFVKEFALPVASITICEFLGLDPAWRNRFLEPAEALEESIRPTICSPRSSSGAG